MVGELHLPFINKLSNWYIKSSFLAAAAYDSQIQFIHQTNSDSSTGHIWLNCFYS